MVGLGHLRIEQLSKEGWFKKLGANRWRISEVVKGMLKYRDDADRRINRSAVRSRVQAARAREIELRTAQRAQILCETDEALALAADVFGNLRSEL
jgi:hypothetical protein